MKQIIIIFFLYTTCNAQYDVPLTLYTQFNGKYDYTIIGNTNNEFDNWQVPPPPCQILTQSNATLNIQPNQTIVAAYLYWSGIGNGSQQPFPLLNMTEMIPDQTFVADINPPVAPLLYFTNFKDITSFIQTNGNISYLFSNYNLNTLLPDYCSNNIYYSGWNIIVIYEDQTLPNKQLNIYNGLKYVGYDNVNSINLVIGNLNIINNQNAKMTYVAYNGSPNLFVNESITFNGNVLSNAFNPANNPFNGTNTFTGSTTNWNQDIDTFDISPYINVGDTQADVVLSSLAIRTIQTIVTSIRSELPDATVGINQITGKEICNNRDLNISYAVSNTNSNAILPANVPVSFYANNVLLQTINTTSSVPIGGNLALASTVSIPISIPNTFTLKIVADNSATIVSTVAESNENNNEVSQSVTLIGATINPTFSIPTTLCQGANVPALPLLSANNISGTWLPNVISNQNSGSYVFTPNAGTCGLPFTLNVTILPSINPTFSLPTTFCQGANVPALPLISSNNIAGTWLPNVISNQNSGSYIFTPNPGQCGLPFTLNVTISPSITPTFSIATNFCQGANVPALPLLSSNNISGTWSPDVISNQNSGSYVFTPNVGTCGSLFTLNVSIESTAVRSETVYICEDENGDAVFPASLSTELDGGNYTFAWSENGVPILHTQASLNVFSAGNYEVVASPIVSGCAILFDFQVVPLQPISVDIVVPTTDFQANPVVVVNASGGSGTFIYSFNNLPFQNNSVFNVRDSGSIPIVVTDVNGCYTFSETVEVWNYPRFFTPNNDGFNDTWGIVSEKPIAIEIFNRYGALLQKLTNNERWNGFFNNQPLPATDYWFVVYYDDKMFKSHFSLKR